jgi:hypothetical protein
MSDNLFDKAQIAVEDFLKIDARNVKPEEFGRLQAKANVGIKVMHDEKVEMRETRNQALRAISMAFTDPKVREDYIRQTSPKLLPALDKKSA